MKDGNSFGVNEITAATTALHRFLIVHLTKTLLFSVPASRFVPVFKRLRNTYVNVGGVDVLCGAVIFLIWGLVFFLLIVVAVAAVSFIELQYNSVIVIWAVAGCNTRETQNIYDGVFEHMCISYLHGMTDEERFFSLFSSVLPALHVLQFL